MTEKKKKIVEKEKKNKDSEKKRVKRTKINTKANIWRWTIKTEEKIKTKLELFYSFESF